MSDDESPEESDLPGDEPDEDSWATWARDDLEAPEADEDSWPVVALQYPEGHEPGEGPEADDGPKAVVAPAGSASRVTHVRRRRRRRRAGWVLTVAGVVVLVGVGAWQLTATLWTQRSERVGRSLVHQFLHNQSLSSPVTSTPSGPGGAATTATLAACSGSGTGKSSDPVAGLLEIPKLGVVAPVEQGVGDSQLNVAVGHYPQSVWPGAAGNAILEAHDVSYFIGLASLTSGDTVRYVTPCTTYDFSVSSHSIVTQGSPVYNSATPTVTLITCWPTDALWFTPDRYLVTATLTSHSPTPSGGHSYVTATAPPTTPIPAALVSEGVTLTTYSLPMGTFTLAGNPNPAWAQSTNPLLDQGSGVGAYIAGVRALTQDRLDWWAAIAPGVTPPAPLVGAHNPSYLTATNVTLTVTGASPTAETLTDTVQVTGGSAPGRYTQTVQETISNGTLLITAWTMQPA